VPNLFLSFGYTNASWTLRSDLTARTACRLLNHMEARGYRICAPRPSDGLARRPMMELNSGYVQRGATVLPSQSDRAPWRVPQNYVKDLAAMTFGRIDEELELEPHHG
jgi:hypothetical protein